MLTVILWQLALGMECKVRVYVYDLEGTAFWDVEDLTQDAVFGAAAGLQGALRETRQWSLSQILTYRLLRSRCRTREASEADVFFAPLWPKPKAFHQWLDVANVSEETVLRALPYVTTGKRHFVAVSKSFRSCASASWFYDPAHPAMRDVVKLAYDEPLAWQPSWYDEPFLETYMRDAAGLVDRCQALHGKNASRECGDRRGRYPKILSVPYPSSVHWSAGGGDPVPETSRHILMLFVGHFERGAVLRTRIKAACHGYHNRSVCTVTHDTGTPALLLKAKAQFCLEPFGDSPSRKSISDSIACGCIPVVFGNVTAAQYPHFWHDGMRLVVDVHRFLSGDLDLRDFLQSQTPDQVAAMQETLRSVKKTFTYSLDDDQGDALDVILDTIATGRV